MFFLTAIHDLCLREAPQTSHLLQKEVILPLGHVQVSYIQVNLDFLVVLSGIWWLLPQILSSDCLSLGPSTAPGAPGVHTPAVLGKHLAAILSKRGILRPGWGHTVGGLANPRHSSQSHVYGQMILLVTLLTFSKHFPTYFENTQNKCYHMGLMVIFFEPKSPLVSHQANVCLLYREDHPMPIEQKGAGTSIGGLAPWPKAPLWVVSEKTVWPPLEVMLVL